MWNRHILICIGWAMLSAPKPGSGNELVGGLYGIKIGKVFFGESMFSKASNASKFAFICYVKQFNRKASN
jgi:Leu/Phe-tRNA-protein transferase